MKSSNFLHSHEPAQLNGQRRVHNPDHVARGATRSVRLTRGTPFLGAHDGWQPRSGGGQCTACIYSIGPWILLYLCYLMMLGRGAGEVHQLKLPD